MTEKKKWPLQSKLKSLSQLRNKWELKLSKKMRRMHWMPWGISWLLFKINLLILNDSSIMMTHSKVSTHLPPSTRPKTNILIISQLKPALLVQANLYKHLLTSPTWLNLGLIEALKANKTHSFKCLHKKDQKQIFRDSRVKKKSSFKLGATLRMTLSYKRWIDKFNQLSSEWKIQWCNDIC